jgi:hypothetical protein
LLAFQQSFPATTEKVFYGNREKRREPAEMPASCYFVTLRKK